MKTRDLEENMRKQDQRVPKKSEEDFRISKSSILKSKQKSVVAGRFVISSSRRRKSAGP